jgi:hypothetical protein
MSTETHLDKELIRIYSCETFEQALQTYSQEMKTRLENWFQKNPEYISYKLFEEFYKFKILFENFTIEEIMSNNILYEGRCVPDGLILHSKVDKNVFNFVNLDLQFVVDKNCFVVFPYSEKFFLKASNYYAASFCQQQ